MSAKRNFEDTFGDDMDLMVDTPYFPYKMNHLQDHPAHKSYPNLLKDLKMLCPGQDEENLRMVVKEGGDNLESILSNLWPDLKHTDYKISWDAYPSESKNLKKISENSINQNGTEILAENTPNAQKLAFPTEKKSQDDLIMCEIKESKLPHVQEKKTDEDKYADQIEELLKSETDKLVLQKWTHDVAHGIKNFKGDKDFHDYLESMSHQLLRGFTNRFRKSEVQ